MDLAGRIAARRAGQGVSAELLGELRRTPLLVPLLDGGLLTGTFGGVSWVYAFTDAAALARFAPYDGPAGGEPVGGEPAGGSGGGEPGGDGAHDGVPDDPARPHVTVLGARLLDVVIPSLTGPTGVAVNVADGDRSMLFPPVRGIVPDAVAVDLDARDDLGKTAR
ncbi:hypothetical protein [Streptomyces oceani]|uniref:SseB protein N-terminal domain-containing protein n=1 Tax=Streptomyces oceani TaxID=1075402 RepID=A0A1E7JF25_9ACTN|nr:hypothetical protein [Streptomyces oceani]OEU85079.1 hypothetical protein AN216_26210 [Streptomyces oceani]